MERVILTTRPAVLADAAWLLALRNDPETVRWSVSGVPVTPEKHAEWFAQIITDPTRALMVVAPFGPHDPPFHDDPVPQWCGACAGVATYRLDRVGSDQVEVSLAVAPEYRGRGYAVEVIALASRHALRRGAQVVIVLVKRDNTRSLRAFLRAGFSLNPPSTDDGDLLLLAKRVETREGGEGAKAPRRSADVTGAGLSAGSTPAASTMKDGERAGMVTAPTGKPAAEPGSSPGLSTISYREGTCSRTSLYDLRLAALKALPGCGMEVDGECYALDCPMTLKEAR